MSAVLFDAWPLPATSNSLGTSRQHTPSPKLIVTGIHHTVATGPQHSPVLVQVAIRWPIRAGALDKRTGLAAALPNNQSRREYVRELRL